MGKQPTKKWPPLRALTTVHLRVVGGVVSAVLSAVLSGTNTALRKVLCSPEDRRRYTTWLNVGFANNSEMHDFAEGAQKAR